MDYHYKSYLIERILYGKVVLKLGDNSIYISPPSLEDKLSAEEIYQEKLQEARWDGMLDSDDLLYYLVYKKLWSTEEETKLTQIDKDMDEIKYKMFSLKFKSEERKNGRKYLDIARKEKERLVSKKHQYDHATCEGYAQGCKFRYLLEKCVDGDYPIDKIITLYYKAKLTDITYRELARTEPWRSYWSTSKNDVFGKPSAFLTEEQRSLIVWSQMYDSIYKSPECPHETVIEDDDLLDGWLIHQRKERDKDALKSDADSITGNQKIKNAQEVFVMTTGSKEDITKVESLNDPMAKIKKMQRQAYLQKYGEVKESDMPDTKQNLLMQYNRMLKERNK